MAAETAVEGRFPKGEVAAARSWLS
ncbi:chemotaxis-specific methylesterase domain protein, partial [Vibrio cholerae HC-33A2]